MAGLHGTGSEPCVHRLLKMCSSVVCVSHITLKMIGFYEGMPVGVGI